MFFVELIIALVFFERSRNIGSVPISAVTCSCTSNGVDVFMVVVVIASKVFTSRKFDVVAVGVVVFTPSTLSEVVASVPSKKYLKL